MFLGEYQHSLDAKGRIIMPSKFREVLSSYFIITKGLDRCLFVYDLNEWKTINDKIKELPVTDEGVRRFVRFFFGGALEAEPDSQGRVLIPQNLRQYAGIIKEVTSIGVSNRIEIWSKENMDEYNGNSNFIDGELAMRLASLGI